MSVPRTSDELEAFSVQAAKHMAAFDLFPKWFRLLVHEHGMKACHLAVTSLGFDRQRVTAWLEAYREHRQRELLG